MERLARGEIHALGEIYERHHAAVHRFVARSTAGSSDTEDIVHNTFLLVPRIAKSFDARLSCRAWLLGIAARLMHRRGRSLTRFARMILGLGEEQRRAPKIASSPEQRAIVTDELEVLEAGLQSLREPKRVVLLMAEVEGLTSEEIARTLQIPVGTVWTRLHHARRELRAYLDAREVGR
jgi:RNA polymerase sigma-70 factor (ECF subfamily)